MPNTEGTWIPFDKDFEYEKKFYDVKTAEGKVYKECWPNAGRMHVTSGKINQQFTITDGVFVRLSRAQG